jgi:voltage-gated potassium channel
MVGLFTQPKGILRILRQKIGLSLGLFFLVILGGATGFRFIENFDWIDAVYMTVITVSTVGYGEIHPLSHEGRIFAIALILVSLSVFAFGVSTITGFFWGGEAREFFKYFKMNTAIESLHGHVIVCGFGRNGRQVCTELFLSHKPFVVVENDENEIEMLQNQIKFLYVKGDATDEQVLTQAGIERASTLISTLPKDADNLYVVLTGRELNPNLTIISRASTDGCENKLRRAGADYVVMPERIGGTAMASFVTHPTVVSFISFLTQLSHTEFYFDEIDLTNLKPDFSGASLRQLDLRNRFGTTVIAAFDGKDSFTVNPPGDYVIAPGTRLILLGNSAEIAAANDYLITETQ